MEGGEQAFLPPLAELCWQQVLLGVQVGRFQQICLEFTHSHVPFRGNLSL